MAVHARKSELEGRFSRVMARLERLKAPTQFARGRKVVRFDLG